MTFLITIEGVLKSGPKMIREGRILVDALEKGGRRIVYMSDETVEKAEHWLGQNGIRGHAGVLSPSVAVDDVEPLRQRQIAVARNMGHVDLVIDPDPEVISHCLDLRVSAMLFAHPESSKPEWRPDGNLRTWADITEKLQHKKAKEAESE